VNGNGNGRDFIAFLQIGVGGDDAFHGSLLEENRVLFQQVWPVTMADNKVEIAFLDQMILNSGEDQSGVALADFRNDDANGETAPLPEGSGH